MKNSFLNFSQSRKTRKKIITTSRYDLKQEISDDDDENDKDYTTTENEIGPSDKNDHKFKTKMNKNTTLLSSNQISCNEDIYPSSLSSDQIIKSSLSSSSSSSSAASTETTSDSKKEKFLLSNRKDSILSNDLQSSLRLFLSTSAPAILDQFLIECDNNSNSITDTNKIRNNDDDIVTSTPISSSPHKHKFYSSSRLAQEQCMNLYNEMRTALLNSETNSKTNSSMNLKATLRSNMSLSKSVQLFESLPAEIALKVISMDENERHHMKKLEKEKNRQRSISIAEVGTLKNDNKIIESPLLEKVSLKEDKSPEKVSIPDNQQIELIKILKPSIVDQVAEQKEASAVVSVVDSKHSQKINDKDESKDNQRISIDDMLTEEARAIVENTFIRMNLNANQNDKQLVNEDQFNQAFLLNVSFILLIFC
jgi:hypothetical protein